MRRYLHRIIICLVPVVISAAVVAWAFNEYRNGRGGIRLGVDLAGGTILVYEVDDTKIPAGGFKEDELAAALKRRIDPNDLYSITIRPIPGTPPRVEIILPTGGLYQAEAEKRNWNNLIEAVVKRYLNENVDNVRLLEAALPSKTVLDVQELIRKLKPDANTAEVEEFVQKHKGDWKKLLEETAKQYPFDAAQLLLAAVPQSNYVELGDVIKRYNPELKPEEVNAFIEQNSGASQDKRLLSSTEVEAIKALIEKQGRLEFRILANTSDDQPAMEATQALLKDPKVGDRLRDLERRAEPPLVPTKANGEKESFYVRSPIDENHTYSWVELGKPELYSLRLNSAALARPENAQVAARFEEARKNHEAVTFANFLIYSREITDWSRRNPRDKQQGKKYEFFALVRDPVPGQEITGDYLVSTGQGSDKQGRLSINFTFNNEGGNLFYEVTSKNKPTGSGETGFRRHLAIIFDGQIVSAPSLNEPIRTNGQISGEFTQQDITDMLRILRAGALPATLKKDPVSQASMGATLGQDTIEKGTRAVFWSFIAVMAFMVFYYRFAGFVACVALLANLLLTIAFMVLVKAAFTLPGLAGLVLMLGMAVDANVLIYERLREERERGASLAVAIRNGYDRAFPTIIDTHLSSIFTAIVLYVVGNDQLKGFGISLTVGLVISLFTSLFMTRTMFDVWQAKHWLNELRFAHVRFRLFGRQFDLHHPGIDFMAIRNYWFAATLILTVLGAGLFFYRLQHGGLNIDFVGGTAYTGELVQPLSLVELRDKLEPNHPFQDLSIEQVYKGTDSYLEGKSSMFTIRVSAGRIGEDQENTKETNMGLVFKFVHDRLGDNLKKVHLKRYTINPAGTESILEFTTNTGEPEYVAPGQIQLLLRQECEKLDLPTNAFQVDKAGNEKDQRYDRLKVTVSPTVSLPAGKFEEVLKRIQAEMEETAQPERLENFDAQLAASTRTRALYAILASWAAILLYLWFRFGSWTFGAAAVLCLVHDLFFTLGAVAGCHYIYQYAPGVAWMLGIHDFKFDLPSVAALLTLVGYSVNDTIVVFDRIREVRGKNPDLTPKMINDSINQTLSRTLLASMTVWVVVIVLYIFGGEGVKLFAFVMVVGVIIGTYSSIYVASPLLLLFREGHPADERARIPQTTPVEG